MARRNHTTADLIRTLWAAEVESAQGQPRAAVFEQPAITAHTHHRFREGPDSRR